MKFKMLFLPFIVIFLWCSVSQATVTLKGDFDLDGDVDGDDLAVFSENFGKTDRECTNNEECSGCNAESYCAKEVGDCYGTGMCSPRPDVCPDVWDPVCGCDGSTYENACYAAMAGVNAAYEGECSPPPCTGNEDCGGSDYCAKTMGDCEGKGECVSRPVGCPDVWDPVCGCDERTYANACEAAMAGVNIAHDGECLLSGCLKNSQCIEGNYCAKGINDCEGEGTCEAMPEVCPLVYDPVCGCDGRTYGNACEAAAAGINVLFKGACK